MVAAVVCSPSIKTSIAHHAFPVVCELQWVRVVGSLLEAVLILVNVVQVVELDGVLDTAYAGLWYDAGALVYVEVQAILDGARHGHAVTLGTLEPGAMEGGA